MKLQIILSVLIPLFAIGVFLTSQNPISSVYGQELSEYESDLLGIKLQYPKEWEENMNEETSSTSENNHHSLTFNLIGDNILRIYVHDTDPGVKNLNQLMLDQINLLTSTGSFAVKFIELNQNVTLADLPAIKIVNDQNFQLGNDPNLTTLMQILALSDDGSKTYGVTYRIDKPLFEEYLTEVEKIISSIEFIQ